MAAEEEDDLRAKRNQRTYLEPNSQSLQKRGEGGRSKRLQAEKRVGGRQNDRYLSEVPQ